MNSLQTNLARRNGREKKERKLKKKQSSRMD
jgi:hypothetical protein